MDKLFGWLNYLKYSEMNRLTISIFKNNPLGNRKEVNCYIDLGSITAMIYNNPMISIDDPKDLSSCVLNYAGYIREYFRSYHSVNARIFLVYSDNEWSILKSLCSDYLSRSNKKSNMREYNYVHDSMAIVKMISQYLPEVYFIESECETDGVILATIWRENEAGNDNPNIVLGREVNLVQLPIVNDRTYFYYKKIYRGHAVGYGVTRENALINYLKFTNRYNPIYENSDGIVYIQSGKDIRDTRFFTKTHKSVMTGKHISNFIPEYMSALIAMVGLGSRDIRSRMNWQTAVEALSNFTVYIDDPMWIYNNANLSKKIYTKMDYEDFVGRYKAVDVKFHANMYKLSSDYKVDYRINLQNSSELQYVNDHYFSNKNFIDLNKF